MRIGIAVKPGLAAARDTLVDLESWLRNRGVDAVWSPEAARLFGSGSRPTAERTEMPAQADLFVVLGGDGTLLAMAKAIAESGRDIPILAVNFGSLGFLTEITRPELHQSLETVIAGRASYDLRMMLRATAARAGVSHMALNDVVFSRTALSRMIELSVSVGDQFVTAVKADGLIVATPTGSTAYNLAAGGPIAHPGVDGLLLTPIAPHMLTNRPLVIPGASTIEVAPKLDGSSDEMFVTFDGQAGHPVQANDVVKIRRAARSLRLVRASNRTYFDVLRQKLKWGER